jgi:plasmid maintenance system antidote protein VapI
MTLKEFLDARGIAFDAAALLAGVDTSTVYRITNGEVHPRPETVIRLARACGTSVTRMNQMIKASRAQAAA